jgi:hypothetical protein
MLFAAVHESSIGPLSGHALALLRCSASEAKADIRISDRMDPVRGPARRAATRDRAS